MALTNHLLNEALRDINRAVSAFDQSLSSSFYEPTVNNYGRHTSGARYPPTDILETSNGYEIHAEVPGVQKKDIDIQVTDDHTIVLKGEVKYANTESSEQQKQDKESKTKSTDVVPATAPHWWRSERVTGSFSRSFSFPQT
ncbi:HSP20-like chaperone, partial [Cunninghamella echinulata]